MAAEIELKVRVDDPESLKVRLSELGRYLAAYEKDDTYWFPENPESSLPPSGVRVRLETNSGETFSESVLVTWKTRRMEGGVEINNEKEFGVSNGEIFSEFLSRLGLKPGIKKHKQGWAWACPSENGFIRAELSQVRRLGWFLEMEITGVSAGENAPGRLFVLLDALGIPREKIETRPYTLMLAECGPG
jgi:adenylate cyclase class 2